MSLNEAKSYAARFAASCNMGISRNSYLCDLFLAHASKSDQALHFDATMSMMKSDRPSSPLEFSDSFATAEMYARVFSSMLPPDKYYGMAKALTPPPNSDVFDSLKQQNLPNFVDLLEQS